MKFMFSHVDATAVSYQYTMAEIRNTLTPEMENLKWSIYKYLETIFEKHVDILNLRNYGFGIINCETRQEQIDIYAMGVERMKILNTPDEDVVASWLIYGGFEAVGFMDCNDDFSELLW